MNGRSRNPDYNPLHAHLMKLHIARRRLLLQLEVTASAGENTEDISVALSENRGEARATLMFLHDDVLTRPGSLDNLPQPPEGDDEVTRPAPLGHPQSPRRTPPGAGKHFWGSK